MIKHESYKRYRNKIIEIIEQSKQTCYQNHFEEKKKDSKTIWLGKHEIISSRTNKKDSNVSGIIADDSTIAKPIEIAKSFNNFFTSIGTKLRKKISPRR